jgi:hypothetical protein
LSVIYIPFRSANVERFLLFLFLAEDSLQRTNAQRLQTLQGHNLSSGLIVFCSKDGLRRIVVSEQWRGFRTKAEEMLIVVFFLHWIFGCPTSR